MGKKHFPELYEFNEWLNKHQCMQLKNVIGLNWENKKNIDIDMHYILNEDPLFIKAVLLLLNKSTDNYEILLRYNINWGAKGSYWCT